MGRAVVLVLLLRFVLAVESFDFEMKAPGEPLHLLPFLGEHLFDIDAFILEPPEVVGQKMLDLAFRAVDDDDTLRVRLLREAFAAAVIALITREYTRHNAPLGYLEMFLFVQLLLQQLPIRLTQVGGHRAVERFISKWIFILLLSSSGPPCAILCTFITTTTTTAITIADTDVMRSGIITGHG